MNAQEVNALREQIFEDNKVTKEEVLDLWEKKDTQSETSIEFDALFADAVMAWLLEDSKIDEEEAQFLIEKIGEDDEVDDSEGELLMALADYRNSGNEIPQSLVDAFPGYFDEIDDSEEE